MVLCDGGSLRESSGRASERGLGRHTCSSPDSLTGEEGSWGVWEVPRTAHTGGSWQIIDGFATEDECAAIVEACAGLEELAEPLARYAAPPTRSDYRSADASRLVSETHDVARALAERAARVTGVPKTRETTLS